MTDSDLFNAKMRGVSFGRFAGTDAEAFSARRSGLHVGYFDSPAERARELFVKWRWIAIGVLIVALAALAVIGDGGIASW